MNTNLKSYRNIVLFIIALFIIFFILNYVNKDKVLIKNKKEVITEKISKVDKTLPKYLTSDMSTWLKVYAYDLLEDNLPENGYHFYLSVPDEVVIDTESNYKLLYFDNNNNMFTIEPHSLMFSDLVDLYKDKDISNSDIEYISFKEDPEKNIWQMDWKVFNTEEDAILHRYYFTEWGGITYGFVITLPNENTVEYIHFVEKILSTFHPTSMTPEYAKKWFGF